MSALSKRLGAALKEVREGTGISGAELARRLEKKQSYLTEWESGRKLVPLPTIADAERALGVPLGTVLTHAGFVEPASSTTAALLADETLTESNRRLVIDIYKSMTLRAQGPAGGVLDDVQR